jgi:hypothetical protein
LTGKGRLGDVVFCSKKNSQIISLHGACPEGNGPNYIKLILNFEIIIIKLILILNFEIKQ